MYDYIIITHIPNFYKVNLYNELSKKFKILVIFTAKNTKEKRSDDFITLVDARFDYKVLFDGQYEERNVFKNIISINKIFKKFKYKRILVSGWDTKEDWFSVLSNSKGKNCLALESTINDSTVSGIKGLIKRIFLSRISATFASGSLHRSLLEKLNYKGKVVITKGVGIINKPKFNFIKKDYKKRFLFIGRLSKEKNIDILINLFNNLNDYKLTIIGTGPLGQELRNNAQKNIIFKGVISNQNLKEHFEVNDIILLPSISETWGLVVEEALYFGMPAIVNDNCGVSELIKYGVNGYTLNFRNIESVKNVILSIDNKTYQSLLKGVSEFSLLNKDIDQVNSYDISKN